MLIRALLSLCFILLHVTSLQAACTGASPTWTCSGSTWLVDVQSVVDSSSPGPVSNGDTFNVSGAATTAAGVTIVNAGNHNFSIIGNGVSTTSLTLTASINGFGLLLTTAPGTGITRISSIKFDGAGFGTNFSALLGVQGNSGQVRVDNNSVILGGPSGNGTNGINFYNYVRGVADHNTFTWNGPTGIASYTFHDTWGNVGANGDNSWAVADSLGALDAVYFENNTFDYIGSPSDIFRFAQDGWRGMRRVDRFNTYHNTIDDMHGLESTGRHRGLRHLEVYGNTFNYDNTNGAYANALDGRGGIIYGFQNTVNLSNGATLQSFFNVKQENGELQAYSPFGFCGQFATLYTLTSLTSSGTTATLTLNRNVGFELDFGSANPRITVSGATQANYNGTFPVTQSGSTLLTYTMPGTATSPATGTIVITSPWNGQTDSYQYPCMDQTGRGQGDSISGDTAGSTPTSGPQPVGWPHQALRPSYGFLNTVNSVTNTVTTQDPNFIKLDRDAFTDVTPFTGASGVGNGLRSARPASPTLLNVGWWSTDQGGHWNTTSGSQNNGCLDVWNGSTWVNCAYTPCTYPHPLISGGGCSSGGGGGTTGTFHLGVGGIGSVHHYHPDHDF